MQVRSPSSHFLPHVNAEIIAEACQQSYHTASPLYITETEDGFILSLVKSLRSVHLAAGAIVVYEGEIADEMQAYHPCFCLASQNLTVLQVFYQPRGNQHFYAEETRQVISFFLRCQSTIYPSCPAAS